MVDDCFRLIQPFQGLTIEAIVFGLCGETGEAWEASADFSFDREHLTKELVDIVVYAFLYMHAAEVPWYSSKSREVNLNSLGKDETKFFPDSHILVTSPFVGLALSAFRLAEMEKKLLRGTVVRQYGASAELIYTILCNSAHIARQLKVNLEEALRKVILDNHDRHRRGDFGHV